jgi:hypothetical protein
MSVHVNLRTPVEITRVNWTYHDEGEDLVQAQSLDDRREKVLESVGRQMQVLSEAEEPYSGVGDRLLESLPGRSLLLSIDSVSEQSGVGELPLFLIQPLGGKRSVGKEWPGAKSNETSDGTCQSAVPHL